MGGPARMSTGEAETQDVLKPLVFAPGLLILEMLMESRTQITRVVLENYKSIAFCDVRLGQLNILVGPNGAGKSNFLDALRFLSEAVNGFVENALHDRGGFDRVLHRAVPNGGHLSVRIEFQTSDQISGYYSLRLEKVTAGEYRLEREKCCVGSEYYEFDRRTSIPVSQRIGNRRGVDRKPAAPQRRLLAGLGCLCFFP